MDHELEREATSLTTDVLENAIKQLKENTDKPLSQVAVYNTNHIMALCSCLEVLQAENTKLKEAVEILNFSDKT